MGRCSTSQPCLRASRAPLPSPTGTRPWHCLHQAKGQHSPPKCPLPRNVGGLLAAKTSPGLLHWPLHLVSNTYESRLTCLNALNSQKPASSSWSPLCCMPFAIVWHVACLVHTCCTQQVTLIMVNVCLCVCVAADSCSYLSPMNHISHIDRVFRHPPSRRLPRAACSNIVSYQGQPDLQTAESRKAIC